MGSAEVIVAPNAVVDSSLFERARQPVDFDRWFDHELPTLVGVGRLVRQKNFGLLLEAAALLEGRRPVRVLLVGDGDDRRALAEQARTLGIESRVLFTGFTPNPYSLIARSSALVLSSFWETLPTVLIEAMALGIPCVATDCDFGPREILDNGRFGRLVPIGDPGALADAIEQTLINPVASPENLRSRAACYSYDAAVDRYVQILDLVSSTSPDRIPRCTLRA
jgi:glycosyltransferase involved in cell wall biosynthesis